MSPGAADARCPSCASTAVEVLGPIPASETFAGVWVGALPATELARCRSCGLGFRHPQPDRELLARLYASGDDTSWSTAPHLRVDWSMTAALIAEWGAREVLDVGCFDGGFLTTLPSEVGKRGIEIHAGAADRARQRGIDILASDLHEIEELGRTFECVTAFDVIEHVHDPRAFLESAYAAVAPGGTLVIATGNLQAPTWRVMGSRYQYCWFPEHIAFITPDWVEKAAHELGADVAELRRFAHRGGGRGGFAVGALKNLGYRVAPGLVDGLRNRPDGDAPAAPAAPPAWPGARDHLLIALRKPGEGR